MDPSYSVLLGEKEAEDECGEDVKGKKNNNKLLPVYIVVPIVVVALIVVAAILLAPR